MKNLTKFALFAALCGVFVACDDSSSNSSGSELPANIKNVSDILDYECNEARQCAKLYAEDVDDTLQCVSGEWGSFIASIKNECSDVSSSSSVDPESPQGDMSSSSSINDASIYNASTNTLMDLRDDQTYKTVTIGEQTWMAENLNYAYNEKTSSLDSSSFCYENSADSCSKYGRLYLWSAAMDSAAVFSDEGKGCGYHVTCSASGNVRGVCPEGWHLPSDNEWFTLIIEVVGRSSASTRLKSTSGWYDDGNGEDSYGFSVLPAGDRSFSGTFYYSGSHAYFWSSTELDSDYAYRWNFLYVNASILGGEDFKDYAFSVRCVRD